MSIPRIYLPITLATGETCSLDERARHHIINVLRLKTGTEITVFNGRGGEFSATLLTIDKKATLCIQTFNAITRESCLETHLHQGISRGERMDYTVQKAAELGITAITPVFTARTIVKIPDTKIDKKIEHWQAIAISACEQSGRTQIPIIHPPITLTKLLGNFQNKGDECNLVFDMEAAVDLNTHLTATQCKTFNFIMGPEGGLDSQEINAASNAGFTCSRLGPRIFRTETAGPVVLAILQFMKGDLGKPI